MLEERADGSGQQRSFQRVVALHEASKELVARSFRVNLLALDAMVQSKRGGSSLRGFDEVSSQMRSWSRSLHCELERLAALSRTVVTEVSGCTKSLHLLRLLRSAVEGSEQPLAQRALERHTSELDERTSELERTWRSVRGLLSDLEQLGMMAVVLSRSAMIEASSGTPEQRAQLGDVSHEFYQNSEAVNDVLRGLIKLMKLSEAG